MRRAVFAVLMFVITDVVGLSIARADDPNASYCRLVNTGGTVEDLERESGIKPTMIMHDEDGLEVWLFSFTGRRKEFGEQGAYAWYYTSKDHPDGVEAFGFAPIDDQRCWMYR